MRANKVVTAAHCVDGATAGKLTVKWGGLDRSHLPRQSAVTKLNIHEGWNPKTLANDVAVLTLADRASETGTVRFAHLATEDPALGTLAQATGWGAIHPGGPLARMLHTVPLPVTTHAACSAAYASRDQDSTPQDPRPVLTDGMLCAGYPEGGKGICRGDAGGPLAVNGKVVGIASWERGCGQANSPSVFTSVAHYRSWISSQ
ncbi:serine protease [Streptomyces sp. H27-S2]|uniref:serine protease n=1 Tax=Streptomyces antarcticus TaxID=2996458 RepID=UPI00226D48AC|nr:serine protease [Streptomyces sp. H27-S2]MCY0950464.1 serine protease [Streptomyces sp. H27-S2]